MSAPSSSGTICGALTKWMALASQIFNGLSDREAKGWSGDTNSSETPLSDDLCRLVGRRKEITVWCDTSRCTWDLGPLFEFENLLLHRSRHFKPENMVEVYEAGIPSAEEQLRQLENASRMVARMLAVAESEAVGSQDESKVIEPGYLGLSVDRLTGVVRRAKDKYAAKFLQLKLASAELHTLIVAIKAGSAGGSPTKWKGSYPGNWSGRRNVKSRLGGKLLGCFDIVF